MNSTNSTRRDFLSMSVTAGVAAGLSTGGYFTSTAQASSKKKLGVALVGLGGLSTNQIAPALLNTQRCELAAIVTGTPDKAKAWGQKYGIDKKDIYNYDNFDKIASNDAVDIVYVVLPNSMHHEFTIRAAKAGKHVLCEKPMANSSKDCREMIAACQAANRKLAIGYRCQYEPHHVKMMEIVQSSDFGKIQRINAGLAFKIGDPNQWRLKQALAGGGALMDIGIYALQACRYLTREEPTLITAQETKTDFVKFAEVDESVTWRMDFASGAFAYCSTSYSLNDLNSVEAFGEKSSVKLDPAFSYSGIKLHESGNSKELAQVDQFGNEMDEFAKCIQDDQPSKVSGEEGLKDMLAIEAIYRSIESNKPESVAKV